jgi:hypothetical protein
MKSKTKLMTNEVQTTKQAYQPPVLTELGAVSDLTLTNTTAGDDGAGQST